METSPQGASAAPAESAPANDQVIHSSGDAAAPAPDQQADPSRAPPVTKHSRIQARIDEITRQRYEEERAHQATRAELEALRREREQSKQFSEIDTSRPRIDQYNSLEEYQLAMSDWTAKRTAAMVHAEWEKRVSLVNAQNAEQYERQAQERAQQEQINAVIEQRMDAGRKKYADFVDVVANPELPPIRQHPMLLGALMNCTNAHDIAYTLAKNPGEYERFYAMRNPFQIARELFAIDQKFSGSAATTAAPPPPPNRAGAATSSRDWSEMSTAEHVRAYQARKR